MVRPRVRDVCRTASDAFGFLATMKAERWVGTLVGLSHVGVVGLRSWAATRRICSRWMLHRHPRRRRSLQLEFTCYYVSLFRGVACAPFSSSQPTCVPTHMKRVTRSRGGLALMEAWLSSIHERRVPRRGPWKQNQCSHQPRKRRCGSS